MMENASVALLMLDVASAKSTLTQLQQTFTAADAEHQRTRSQLQHCQDQKQDVHPVYTQLGGKGPAALADRATAQQLQALHMENLQLKSLLKHEINARAELESQHAALLELLRCNGLQDTLSADQLDSGLVSNAPNSSGQQAFVNPLAGTAGTEQTARTAAIAPDQQPQRNSIPAEATIPAVRMPAAGHQEKGNVSFSRSSNSSSDIIAAAGAGTSTAGHRRSQAEAVCPSSAYFPQQQLEQQQRLSREGSGAINAAYHQSAADAHCRASQPAAENTWHGASSRSVKGSIPRQLFLQHDQRHAQQHQPHHHTQQHGHSSHPVGSRNWKRLGADDAAATYAATHGGSSTSSSSGSSYSSSSSHSQASEQLLDSDDLEELATLCDGLISQTQGFEDAGNQHQQQVQHQMAGHAGTAMAAAAAVAAAACTAAHRTGPDSSSYLRNYATDDLQQQQQQLQQQHLQRTHSQPMGHPDVPMPQPQPAIMPPVNLTDIDLLASRLQQLQQQVAAAGFAESYFQQHSSTEGGMPAAAKPAGHAESSAAQQQQQPGTQGAGQTSSHSGLHSSTSSATGTRSRAASSNGGNMLQQQQQQLGGESSGVADLQQQLAQRMQEVKQRLKNICNGMLEDALTGSAKASHSTPHPAADELPAAASSFGARHSQPVQQQQQSGAAAAGTQHGMEWGSSRSRSSCSTNGSGSGSSPIGPETQQQQQPSGQDPATCAQGSTGSDGVRRPVAFIVHGHGAPAPGAGTAANGPIVHGPAGSGKLRQRVVQGFCPSDAAEQAAASGSAAAAAAPVPAGVGMPADSGTGGVRAHAAAAEAAVGHDAAYSESSWSTLEDEEDHVNNEQQHQQEQQQQQQQAPEVYPGALGDEGVTPPRAGSKSRSASGCSISADDSTGSSPSSSSPPLPHQQHAKQHHSGPWRLQRHADMSQSLEGVLFGMGGRISGEVSQTFSPLKAMPAGQSFWSPGSPLTPIKQGKP